MPFKVIPRRYNTHVSALLLILEALYTFAPFGMPLGFSSDAVFIVLIVTRLRPFVDLFDFRNRKKSQTTMAGEYGGWDMISVRFFAKKTPFKILFLTTSLLKVVVYIFYYLQIYIFIFFTYNRVYNN